jgi:hypothetical protein
MHIQMHTLSFFSNSKYKLFDIDILHVCGRSLASLGYFIIFKLVNIMFYFSKITRSITRSWSQKYPLQRTQRRY